MALSCVLERESHPYQRVVLALLLKSNSAAAFKEGVAALGSQWREVKEENRNLAEAVEKLVRTEKRMTAERGELLAALVLPVKGAVREYCDVCDSS